MEINKQRQGEINKIDLMELLIEIIKYELPKSMFSFLKKKYSEFEEILYLQQPEGPASSRATKQQRVAYDKKMNKDP